MLLAAMDTRVQALVIGVPILLIILIATTVGSNKKQLESAGIPTEGAIAADQGTSGADNNAVPGKEGPMAGGNEHPSMPPGAADDITPPTGDGSGAMLRVGPVRLVNLTVLGLPLGQDLPPPTADLTGVRLDPDGIYQLEFAAEGMSDHKWAFEITGGMLSDMLLESYPPQLGNPRNSMSSTSPQFGFKVEKGNTQPVIIVVKVSDAANTYAKTLLIPTTDFSMESGQDYAAGEVLIGLVEGMTVADNEVTEFLRVHELQLIDSLSEGTVLHVREARDERMRTPFDIHAQVIWDPIVRYAEPNYIARIQGN